MLITKAYVRTYSDSGQVTAYVEFKDRRSSSGIGRTEGPERNSHMQMLIAAAARQGVELTRETW